MKFLDKKEVNRGYTNDTEYYYDKIANAQEVAQLINMLASNGYQIIDYKIVYENDHSTSMHPEKFEDYNAFLAKLNENFVYVDDVVVNYMFEDLKGYASIYLNNNSLVITLPTRKSEQTMKM